MNIVHGRTLLAFGLVLGMSVTPQVGRAEGTGTYTCDGARVCVDPSTKLPLRALLRPNAQLRDAADATAKPKGVALPFQPWYVFQQKGVDYSDPLNPKGWYQIHDADKLGAGEQPFAWVQARDIFEWRNAIVVSYSPWGDGSDKRGRVMMFDNKDHVSELVNAGDGPDRAKAILAELDGRKVDVTKRYGLVMAEPRAWMNINERFYILPVLDFAPIPGLSREARYLKVAAAVPQEAGVSARAEGGVGTLASAATRAAVTQDLVSLQRSSTDSLKIDVKFVIDMTGSMQPYIDAVRSGVRMLADQIERKSVGVDAVRFGLVGYTDVADQCGQCRFIVRKNFTPGDLLGGEGLAALLASPDARAVGGGDQPETVFDGVLEGARSNWRDGALRFIVQIGDASSNQAGTKGELREAKDVRSELEANRVRLISLEIKPEGAGVPGELVEDAPVAEQQFRILSLNDQTSAYYDLKLSPFMPDEVKRNEFEKVIRTLGSVLVDAVGAARRGVLPDAGASVAPAPAPAVASAPGSAADLKRVESVGKEVIDTAIVEWLGRAADRPKDFVAWTTDVDLTDSSRDALDVRVLVERRDLEVLIGSMDGLLRALKRKGAMSEQSFFEGLQQVVTVTTLDGGPSGGDGPIKSTSQVSELLPNWIRSLPYTSELQHQTLDDLDRMTANQRANFERGVEAKLRLYKEYQETNDFWHKLSPRLADLQDVYAMKLSDLP